MHNSIIKQVAHCDRNSGSQKNGMMAHLHRTGGSLRRRLFNLAAKYENVKKGVEHIMGGRLLIHEAYVLMEKGRAMERKNTEEAEQRAIEAERLYSKLKEMLNEKQNLQKI